MKNNPRQKQILEYITQHLQEKGYPPTVREIGLAIGLKSSSSVYCYLKALEREGLVKRDPTKPRALEILDPNYKTAAYSPRNEEDDVMEKDIIKVPIIGEVAAGQPILAEENFEDFMPLPYDFVQNDISFILKVKGESMIQIGINSGDYIIVKQQPTAENGDIVVALIENEATVKTFYKEKDHFRLQPENDSMEPIRVRDVKILGKVTGLFRKM